MLSIKFGIIVLALIIVSIFATGLNLQEIVNEFTGEFDYIRSENFSDTNISVECLIINDSKVCDWDQINGTGTFNSTDDIWQAINNETWTQNILNVNASHIGNCSGVNCDFGCGNITSATSDLCTLVDTDTFNTSKEMQDAINITGLSYNVSVPCSLISQDAGGDDTDFCNDADTGGGGAGFTNGTDIVVGQIQVITELRGNRSTSGTTITFLEAGHIIMKLST